MAAGAIRLAGNLEGLCFIRGSDNRDAILINLHVNIHWFAAHLTVFNVPLLTLRALDQKLDLLPAVRTAYVDSLKAKICHWSTTLAAASISSRAPRFRRRPLITTA